MSEKAKAALCVVGSIFWAVSGFQAAWRYGFDISLAGAFATSSGCFIHMACLHMVKHYEQQIARLEGRR